MTVTAIEPFTKTRSRVFLDGTFAFVLYKGELRKYQVEEGKTFSEEELLEIRTQVLPKRAKLRAMNLLKSREYTEKQLLDKLLAGGYAREVAQEAVDYVKAYHYVDDKRYACEYVSCHMGKHSRQEIYRKLLQRGIGREVTDAAFHVLEKEGEASDEGAMIRTLLLKRHYDAETADEKEKYRVYSYLYRKGFPQDKIRREMGM